MDTFQTRVVRVMQAGWAIFGLGMAAGPAAFLFGAGMPFALGLVALSIAIAFGLNLVLLVILWRRGLQKDKNASPPLAPGDAPSYEQPASM